MINEIFVGLKERTPDEERDTTESFDPLKTYLAEIRKHPVLSREDEYTISLKIFEQGDMKAAQKLALSNLRLVIKIALEYYNAYLNILDLIQEGNVGLLHAVKKYNPHKGTKFSTYASFWIRAYILKYIIDSWSLVKVGTTQAQRKLFYRLNGEKQRLEALGIYPTPKLLASTFGLREREIEEMEKRLSYTDVALEAPLHDGSGDTLMDIIGSDQDVEEIVSERQKSSFLSERLKAFKETLNNRDLFILTNRILAEEPMSLQEIGGSYRISRERVRQVEKRILKNFKVHFQGYLTELDIEAPAASLT